MKRTNGKALSVNNAKRRIGINARRVITLTLSNIALQALGFVYRMMLTDCAGTTALGLQSLVMQIYSIAVSVCISGLNVAVITVAARLNAAGGRGIRTLTRCALLAFCVLFLLSAVPSFILRRSIALRLIGDCKTEGAIPLVLICIFLTGTENILKSVHIAAGRVRTTAFSEITEQTARFFLVWLLLKSFAANSAFAMQGEPSFSVKLIITGMVLSEFFSVGFLSVSYFRTFVKKNRTSADTRPAAGRFSALFSELCEILLPAALTSVLGTVFSSAAALLLPGRLYAAGYSHEAALQTIGVLNSVAVPLVVLPMAFAGAVAAVCMPAVSAAVQNNNKNLHRIVKKISRCTDFCRCGESFAAAVSEETVRTALRNRSGLGRVYSADAEILHNTFSNSNDSDTERPKGAENRACVHRFERGTAIDFDLSVCRASAAAYLRLPCRNGGGGRAETCFKCEKNQTDTERKCEECGA